MKISKAETKASGSPMSAAGRADLAGINQHTDTLAEMSHDNNRFLGILCMWNSAAHANRMTCLQLVEDSSCHHQVITPHTPQVAHGLLAAYSKLSHLCERLISETASPALAFHA